MIYLLYTDDSIIAGVDKDQVEEAIRDIEAAGLRITREGDVQDFLGNNIKKLSDTKIKMSQPYLSKQSLKTLRLDGNCKKRSIPAEST